MSEFIADARVRVLPDLSKFNEQLRTDLISKINAFNRTGAAGVPGVRVRAEISGISRTQLSSAQRSVQTAVNRGMKPVAVPVMTSPWAGTLGMQGALAASANQVDKALSKTGTSAQAVRTNFDRMNVSTGKSRAALLGLGSATGKLDAALLGLRTAVGSTAVIGLGAGALAAIALGKAIRSLIGLTASYERELNVFQAVSGASADEMERVAAAAKELGADITLPAVSAADAAVAMAELSKAGLSVQDSIDGARGVLQLATAANIGFADAVELSASVLNAFQLSGKDAVDVADTLANAANAAQGSITDIGLSLQQTTAIAAQAGVSYRDTTAFLTLLAKAGLKGSDAGTSLRTAFIRLINPTAKAQAILDDLGVSIRDASGNIRPDVFIQIANAMRGLSPAARDAKLAILGGQDALRAFAILGRTSTKDFLALRAELRKQGTAAEVAGARTKGLAGSYQALQSTLETVAITIGQRVSPGLTDFVNGITATVTALSQSEGVAAAFSGAMTGVANALNLVGVAAKIAAAPLLAFVNIASKATFGFGSAFVTSILAAVVALKSFNLAVRATAGIRATAAIWIEMATVTRAIEIELGLATVGLTTFQRALISTRAVLAGMVASFNFWLTAIIAAGAAIVFLSTRQSAMERVTKALTSATEDLVSAEGAAKTAAEGLASALRVNETSRLAVAQASLAKETAAAALAGSDAARGSRERRGLEIDLAVATQNVTFAMQDAKKAADDLAQAQLDNEAAALAAKAAMDKEILNLETLAFLASKEDKFTRPTGFGANIIGALTDKAGLTDTQSELEILNASILENAKNWLASGDAALVFRGRAEQVGTTLQTILGRALTPIQWRKLFAEKDMQGLINRAVQMLLAMGEEGGVSALMGFLRRFGIFPKEVVNTLKASASVINPEVENVFGSFGKTGADAFTKGFKESFDTRLLIAEVRGASDQALLAIAQDAVDAAQRKFNRIDARIRKAGGPKDQAESDARAAAAQAVKDAESDVETIQNRIEADAQAAARKTQERADRIAEARNKADQAILDAIAGTRTTAQSAALQKVAQRENAAQRALEAAADTQTLRDDVKAFNLAIAVTVQELKLVNKRIKDADTKIEAQKKLQDRLRELRREKEKTLREITQNAIDRALSKIDLDIELASIKDNAAAERRARLRKIKLLEKQLSDEAKAHGKNTVRYKELRNEIARENAAIKELNKQAKEANKAQSSLMFTFLQTQQGFAANLLGNLIGGGLTGGLVGNVSPTGAATPTAVSAFGLKASPGRALNPEADLVAQGQISAGAKLGVSRGQGTTQVELLRSILQALNDIKRGAGFPGAQYQRRRASAAMDTGSGGGGVVAA